MKRRPCRQPWAVWVPWKHLYGQVFHLWRVPGIPEQHKVGHVQWYGSVMRRPVKAILHQVGNGRVAVVWLACEPFPDRVRMCGLQVVYEQQCTRFGPQVCGRASSDGFHRASRLSDDLQTKQYIHDYEQFKFHDSDGSVTHVHTSCKTRECLKYYLKTRQRILNTQAWKYTTQHWLNDTILLSLLLALAMTNHDTHTQVSVHIWNVTDEKRFSIVGLKHPETHLRVWLNNTSVKKRILYCLPHAPLPPTPHIHTHGHTQPAVDMLNSLKNTKFCLVCYCMCVFFTGAYMYNGDCWMIMVWNVFHKHISYIAECNVQTTWKNCNPRKHCHFLPCLNTSLHQMHLYEIK